MVTADEDSWVGLAGNFARALQNGQPARTYQLGHPGVTSLWVTIAGTGLDRAARLAGLVEFRGNVATRRSIEDAPDFLPALAEARHAHAVANAALVSIVALLTWRLLGKPAGLVAGLLLALDPFFVAHAQIVRMDGLQASLAAIALLAAATRWLSAGHRAFLLLSGVAFGLALLSKVSSLFVLPLLAGLAACGLWTRCRGDPARFAQGCSTVAVDGLLWLTAAGVTFVGLWPAMLAAPYDTLRAMLEFSVHNSGSPPEAGNFFFGSVLADPGPLFYPVALAFRSTPLVLLGLGLLPLALRSRQAPERQRLLLSVLLLSLLLETLLLSVSVKKFDRYALPLVPLLLVLAGAGLAHLASLRRALRRPLLAAAGAAAIFQLTALPPLEPYPLAYFNPLLGGAGAAQHVLLVGWGEGLDLAAARLNELPDAAQQVVSAFHEQALDASFQGQALALERFAESDYVVLPIDAAQRGLLPPLLAAEVATRSPEVLVPIEGLDYVRVYRLPGFLFGESVRVDRVTVEGTSLPLGSRLTVEVIWRPLSDAGVGAVPSLQLLDDIAIPATDVVRATVDQGAVYASGERLKSVARIESPRRAGRYVLAVSFADRAGARLAVTERPPWTTADSSGSLLSALSVRYR
jgi:4-amino-4-deoxy-L-arabinose transferase-like glycosyltransferase